MDVYAPHECSNGCKACHTLIAELRARIAELENTTDAGDEPMQIDADDDNVVILEAFSPVTTAVSNVAASAAASVAADAKKKYLCAECGKGVEFAAYYQKHLKSHKTAPKTKKIKCEWPGCTNKTGFASADSLRTHKQRYHRGKVAKAERSECGKFISCQNMNAHKKIHKGGAKVECRICNVIFSNKENLKIHNKVFAYEHQCIANGNKFSCALDERIAGDSDKQAEARQFDQMRSLFSHYADRHSSIYVLLEALPNATIGREFSLFISRIFYVGSTEAANHGGVPHALTNQSPSKTQKMREIWHAGGVVYMIEVGGMAREEAKIAEGAVIDAFGVRNLVNEKRSLSYAEGKNFSDDRRSFAQVGTHILSLLHAELLNGKARALKSHE